VTAPVRLGAVSYLNVRPLVYGLDRRADFTLRFDTPSECARLLAAGAIDLGMVPSITYLDRPGDRVVPGVAIGSDGPVASVALFARRPMREVRSIALDISSRTSSALVRILCRRVFEIAPSFVPHAPDLDAMLSRADAALLIGDAALFLEPSAARVEKSDLGALWTEMTGLPFVWAFWSGPAGAIDPSRTAVLQAAASDGAAHMDEIAADYCAGNARRIALAASYLRENLAFELTPRAIEGVRTYYREALAAGVVGHTRELTFFDT
jgi:predicted solute-binding protein